MLRAFLGRLFGRDSSPNPTLIELEGVEWPPDWEPLGDPDYAQGLKAELARTAGPGHLLRKEKGPIDSWHAVASGFHSDDVLFVQIDTRSDEATGLWAEVHLTWRKEKDSAWPSTGVFESFEAWADAAAASAESLGDEPCD